MVYILWQYKQADLQYLALRNYTVYTCESSKLDNWMLEFKMEFGSLEFV